jgi:hypothetical protein
VASLVNNLNLIVTTPDGVVWVANQAPGGAALGVENRSTSAATAIRRTTFDQVHSVSGWAWLRRDSDKNNAPRARLMLAR